MPVCFRLGVRGYPTISVLEGSKVYDYQGRLTVQDLAGFVTEKQFLAKSKPRQISHVTSPLENLLNLWMEAKLKVWATTLLLLRAIGLGHLEEQFVVQLAYFCAITPFIIFLVALSFERHMLAKQLPPKEGH